MAVMMLGSMIKMDHHHGGLFFHFSVCTLQGHKNCGQRWDKQTLQRQNICSRQVCSNDKQIYLSLKKTRTAPE